MNRLLSWLVPLAAIALAAGWWFWSQERTPKPAPAPAVTEQPVPAAATEPIRHPLPAIDAAAEPLPSLEQSDAPVKASLEALFGAASITEFLLPMQVVRHTVATIDNLPRSKLAVEVRPVRAVKGKFLVDGDEERGSASTANYERYRPLVQALQAADVKQVALWYRRFYPLFQEAYVSLGYPSGYFNDRLVEVIDHLLMTPDLREPPKLVRHKVFYQFADAALEARSAGQKTLLRMGPENAAIVKDKLRQLRAELTAAPAG